MKKILYIVIASLLISCNQRQTLSDLLLDNVEKAIEINADSAQTLLELIYNPEKLNDKSFARWCMLSGKVTDKINNILLPAEQFERSYDWYSEYGTFAEQVQILIYLGRSYATDGDYDKAMSIYTDALELAKKNDLNFFIGYIYCYMGDLYQMRQLMMQAKEKYKTAACYFKDNQNINSYVCALRDVGRAYTIMDSIECALTILSSADSIAINLENKNIKATIDNTLGNAYLLKGNYEKAKESFFKAIKLGKNKLPNYVALVELYIRTDSLSKAKDLLKEIPYDNSKYAYSIKNLSYQIHKSEKNYEAALIDLEDCSDIVDSILNTTNKSKILNIESRYNNLKIKEKVKSLQIKQQNYVLILMICIIVIILGLLGYILYKKRVEERIRKQEIELKNLKIASLNLSIELDKKKKLLASIVEKDDKYNQMKKEVVELNNKYKKLQAKLISDSPLYKELSKLVNINIPRNKKQLITDELWRLILEEITNIYPNFYDYINSLCPDLSIREIEYCCFILYGFDTNDEAKLLNISPSSVRTKRLRLRQRLNITLPNQTTLYEYLIDNVN